MRFIPAGLLMFLCAFGARGEDLSSVRKGGAPVASVGHGKQAGIVTVKGDFKKGQHAVVVRLDDEEQEYEVVANGTVISVKGNVAVVKLDDDQLVKLPEAGDFVVPLGEPKVFKPQKTAPKAKETGFETEKPPKPEPGYILVGLTKASPTLESSGTDITNSAKQISKMPLNGFRLEWFFDFLPSYGFSFSQASASVPITSYYREDVTADVGETNFRLMFRTENHSSFRFTGFFNTQLSDFKTTNPDELVVGTSVNTTGFGVDLDYEYGNLLLQAPRTKFQFTNLRFEYALASGTATDGAVKRGSGSVSQNELHVSATAQAWLPWVPWVHRYFLTVDSYTRERKLAFTGTTANDSGDSYFIPEGGNYTEKESGLLISFGVRFDDIIGHVFKPKE